MYMHRVVDVVVFHLFKFYRKPVSTEGIQIEYYDYYSVRLINYFFKRNRSIRKQVNIVFSVSQPTFRLFGICFSVISNGRL